MSGLMYVCARCRSLGQPDYGTQRDPGPFPPSGWTEVPVRNEADNLVKVPLCPDCSEALVGWVAAGESGRSAGGES